MKQQGTDYRAAANAADYRAVHRFLAAYGNPPKAPLRYPTLMAERDGEVIGALGTMKHRDAVVAGPLVTHVPGNGAFVSLRLIEWYEYLLTTAGVTTYIAAVCSDHTQWVNMFMKMGCEPMARDDGIIWMKRVIG